MTYARARLWLGIVCVGSIVVLSLIALRLDLPGKLLSRYPAYIAIGMALGSYILISLPFDLFGGYWIQRWYQRAPLAFGFFLTRLVQGVFWQSLIMAICGLAIMQAARFHGLAASVLCVGVLMTALLWGQSSIARLVGRLRRIDADLLPISAALKSWAIHPPDTLIYGATDPGFVGGLIGWPGRASIVIIPAFWLTRLTPEECAVEIARRWGTVTTAAWARGVILALVWNLMGFWLAAELSGSDLRQPAGLITTALWFTLWSFGGLLLLPSLSRPAVFEADRFARDRGIPLVLLTQTILQLDSMQDDEPVRSAWIERIFHPVPSVEARLCELSSEKTSRGAWQCARTALYLSWACFGFLPRAVHCNCGRPELWVLFPGD